MQANPSDTFEKLYTLMGQRENPRWGRGQSQNMLRISPEVLGHGLNRRSKVRRDDPPEVPAARDVLHPPPRLHTSVIPLCKVKQSAAQVVLMHARQLLMLLMQIAEDDWQHLKYTSWNASSSQFFNSAGY